MKAQRLRQGVSVALLCFTGLRLPLGQIKATVSRYFYLTAAMGQSGAIQINMKKILLSAVAAMSLATATVAQTVPSYVPTNGLVGYWGFDGDAKDYSGNGNNGAVNGATLTVDRNGKPNSAYSFDGVNDFIELPQGVLPAQNQSYSINFWAIISPDNNRIESYTVFDDRGQGSYNSKGRFIVLGNKSNSYWYQMGDSVPCTSNGLQLEEWMNIICVYNDFENTIKVYKNGILDCSTTYNDLAFYPGLRQLYIGKGQAPGIQSAEEWRGKIDDIAIYNRALTQQEITALYTSCNLYASITPIKANTKAGDNALLTASAADGSATFQWQTDGVNLGWQNVPSGVTTFEWTKKLSV